MLGANWQKVGALCLSHLSPQGIGQLLHDLLLVKVLLRAPARLVRVPYALPQALR